MQDKLQWIEQDQQKGRRNRKERRTRRPHWEDNFLLEEDWLEEAEASEDLLRRKKAKAKPRREKMLNW